MVEPVITDMRKEGDADEGQAMLEYFDEHAGLPFEQAVELFRRYCGDRKKLAEEARRLKQGGSPH